MLEFTLVGEVGWEIDAWSVRRILSQANGEDIKINFASPGGGVFEGFKIFNLFKNYTGNVDFHIIGNAASMGSYIPMSGRRITVEPNSVFMIHNASIFMRGDHNGLRKAAEITEGLSDIKAEELSKRTGKDVSEIKKMMDEETWFIGGDKIVEAGLADEVVDNPENEGAQGSLQSAYALAQESFKAVMKKLEAEKPDDTEEEAVAFMSKAFSLKDKIVAKTKTAQSGKTQKGAFMNLEKLKAEHPEIYKAAVSEGIEIGAKNAIEKERDRVKAFLVAGEKSGDMETAVKAIKEGSDMTQELSTTFMMTAVNNRDITLKQDDDQDADPGAVATVTKDSEAQAVLDIVAENIGFGEVE